MPSEAIIGGDEAMTEPLAEAMLEDAIALLRLRMEKETWGPVKARLVGVAVNNIVAAIRLLKEAKATKEVQG